MDNKLSTIGIILIPVLVFGIIGLFVGYALK